MSESWHDRIAAVLARGGPIIAYQPIIDLWNDRPVGHEALARFSTGRPDEWFDAAHHTGQGTTLELCAARAALQHTFPAGIYVAVNLCGHTIFDGDLDFVAAARNRVVIEITEHEEIADYERLAERLAPLRVAGVRLSVDDVGAGYASFRHVLALAPDSIKLDRSIVAGVGEHEAEDQRALIAAVATFAARVGCRMVAEGVETLAEAQALRTLGVRYGQGYFFGKPQIPVTG